jgi:hypothetical protein
MTPSAADFAKRAAGKVGDVVHSAAPAPATRPVGKDGTEKPSAPSAPSVKKEPARKGRHPDTCFCVRCCIFGRGGYRPSVVKARKVARKAARLAGRE